MIFYVYLVRIKIKKANMKQIVRNLGLLLILIGVIFLSIVVFNQTQTNTKLGISLALIVIGFIGHIVLSRYLE